jgi:hypothetical protein
MRPKRVRRGPLASSVVRRYGWSIDAVVIGRSHFHHERLCVRQFFRILLEADQPDSRSARSSRVLVLPAEDLICFPIPLSPA